MFWGSKTKMRGPNVSIGYRCRKVNWNCCFVTGAGEVMVGMEMGLKTWN